MVIAFIPRSKRLLISWLQSPSAVILELKQIKSVTVSIVSQSVCHQVMGRDAMILVFWMLSFKPAFSLSSFTFTKRFFSSFTFCCKGGDYWLVFCDCGFHSLFPLMDKDKRLVEASWWDRLTVEKWKWKVKSLSRVWLLATPWTAAHQAPLSMGFSRQEYWSGLSLPSPILYC